MSEEGDNKLSYWLSTYGVITAERLLTTYKIKLNQTDLVSAIKNQHSFYHRLLRIPLGNVLNGIILQHAYDYLVYGQKLFIDYLLSEESSKGEEEQGAATRRDLEEERKQFMVLGDQFQDVRKSHNELIAKSQTALIGLTNELNTELNQIMTPLKKILNEMGYQGKKSLIRQAIHHALIHCDVADSSPKNSSLFVEKMNKLLQVHLTEDGKEKIVGLLSKILDIDIHFDEKISYFINDITDMNQTANSFRTQFYETILRVIDLLRALSDYKINPEQDLINRDPLYFDKDIGAFVLKSILHKL